MNYLLRKLFYKYLSKGMPTDIALQKAKLEFVETGSGGAELPYYWAAAILVGKTNTILMERVFPWKTLVLIAVCISFALLQISNWQSRKRNTALYLVNEHG